MKRITISDEDTFGITDNRTTGFSISFCDEEDKVTIFDLEFDKSSKLIPKDGLDEFWNKLFEVDFQKVFVENSEI